MINEKLQLKKREQFDSKTAHQFFDFKEADFSVGPLFLEYVFFLLIYKKISSLRRFCTYFKMRRKYTYSKKVLYIISINAKDLRRCEGSLKEIYTPPNLNFTPT